ncbi:phage tail protein [Sphaerisporangium rhizosphaerae]|uniref:Phage tail protein n=1 Tax=Sphaerisporangium rhizosphaerae TaxID=2269375 RepID=A0ABW2PJR7_9ACTN
MARVDPYRNYNFLVELDGIRQAGFTECTGFGASVEPHEYREGNQAPSVRKLPTMTKYSNITLKWGLTDGRELFDWFSDIASGRIRRRNGSIVVIDIDGVTEKVRWNFFDAWPTKWDGPDFNATGNAVAIDMLELAYERLTRG